VGLESQIEQVATIAHDRRRLLQTPI